MSEPGGSTPTPPPNPYATPTTPPPSTQPGSYPQYPPPGGPTPPGGAPYPPPGGGPYPSGGPFPPGGMPYPAGSGQYPPYGQNPWPTEPQRKPGVNGFAVAALVLGILPFFPLAIIFGIIALVQTSRTGQKGRGLAIAGLVTGGLWLALVVGSVIWAVLDAAERNEDGEITDEGSVSALDVEVGDCLNGLRATEDETSINSLPAVPCEQPHEGEVYAAFDLEDGDYPGEEAIFSTAEARCDEELMAFSSSVYDDRSIGIFYLYPQEFGWPRDREVVCIAYALEGELTGGLVEQAGT